MNETVLRSLWLPEMKVTLVMWGEKSSHRYKMKPQKHLISKHLG